MTNPPDDIQLTLLQLDNYGPWTVTPSPRRETDLQSLQARLYADFADFVGREDGYAFFDRFDNIIGVTNGIDGKAHERFQERVRNQYPITASMSVGVGETPIDALGTATQKLQEAGSAQDPSRTEILAIDETIGHTDGDLTIAHFDIVDVTGTLTDTQNAAKTTLTVQRTALELAEYMQTEHDSIARFVGGDNMIAVCPTLDRDTFDTARDVVGERAGVELQVGVGRGTTAHGAGYRAKLALEECRENGHRVHQISQQAATD
ncbi:GTP cyclohydrolase IIa [Halovenus amylolytica]|uniref:GTP cyclohydrolase IIa n=1 Tax=Halovenus amylolytica TaxID=2500550 RepID=UPI00360CCE7A